MLRTCTQLLKSARPKALAVRSLSNYPIDDVLFGLNEEQIAVIIYRLP